MKNALISAGFKTHEVIIIQWQYHFAGGFQTSLMYLIGRADVVNRSKLWAGFPDEVNAFVKYSETAGWWPEVEQRYLDHLKSKLVK